MRTHGTHLLDTDTCIAYMKKWPEVLRHLREVGMHNCKISDITLAELYFGAIKSGRQQHIDEVSYIIQSFEQYPIKCFRRYGQIRMKLESVGKPIGDMDMFIAATALDENLILVTGNSDHFSRISELKIENWMKE